MIKSAISKIFDITTAVQDIIEAEPDLAEERQNLIQAITQTTAGISTHTTMVSETA